MEPSTPNSNIPSQGSASNNNNNRSIRTDNAGEVEAEGVRTSADAFAVKGDLSSNRRLAFPWKLYQLLDDCEKNGRESVVSWLPTGRSFRVHNREVFVKVVLPTYFRQTSFKSFQRQLYIYGFTRETCGPDKGSYSHPLFVKGDQKVSLLIERRQNSTLQQQPPEESQKDEGTVQLLQQQQQHLHMMSHNTSLPVPLMFPPSVASSGPMSGHTQQLSHSQVLSQQQQQQLLLMRQQQYLQLQQQQSPSQMTMGNSPNNPATASTKLGKIRSVSGQKVDVSSTPELGMSGLLGGMPPSSGPQQPGMAKLPQDFALFPPVGFGVSNQLQQQQGTTISNRTWHHRVNDIQQDPLLGPSLEPTPLPRPAMHPHVLSQQQPQVMATLPQRKGNLMELQQQQQQQQQQGSQSQPSTIPPPANPAAAATVTSTATTVAPLLQGNIFDRQGGYGQQQQYQGGELSEEEQRQFTLFRLMQDMQERQQTATAGAITAATSTSLAQVQPILQAPPAAGPHQSQELLLQEHRPTVPNPHQQQRQEDGEDSGGSQPTDWLHKLERSFQSGD